LSCASAWGRGSKGRESLLRDTIQRAETKTPAPVAFPFTFFVLQSAQGLFRPRAELIQINGPLSRPQS
jgi:hypothetical protein